MKRAPIPIIVAIAASCATLHGPSRSRLSYDAGLDALSRRDFAAATARFEDASRSDDRDLARRALFMLAAVQLDPSNPRRDAATASDIAARLREGAEPGSLEFMAAGMFERAARESRDLREDLLAARAERDRAWSDIDTLSARMRDVASQRDSLQRLTLRLETVRDSIDKELKKTTQELERIRRAIRR